METKQTKRCPYCGEEIMASAKKCRYCGEWLDKGNKPNTPNRVHDNTNARQNSPKQKQQEEEKKQNIEVSVNNYKEKGGETAFERGFGGAMGGCSGVVAFFVVLLLLMSYYFKSCTGAGYTGTTDNTETPSYYQSESEPDNGDSEANFYDN